MDIGPEKRGFALGTHVTTIYIAQTLGPALAGSVITVTSVFGWRYVFYISGAIALACIPIAAFFIKESVKQKSVKIDWLGSLLFVLALMSGLATLIQSAGRGINTTIDVSSNTSDSDHKSLLLHLLSYFHTPFLGRPNGRSRHFTFPSSRGLCQIRKSPHRSQTLHEESYIPHCQRLGAIGVHRSLWVAFLDVLLPPNNQGYPPPQPD